MWHSLLTFLDKYNGLLTALFTLALVIVTGLLCWLTRKTLLIQKLQIDSTQKSSCAFVYLEGFDKNVLYPPRCDLRLVSNVNAERDVIYIESVLNKLNCIFIDMISGRQITESLSWEDLPSFPKTPELIVASKNKYIAPLLIILQNRGYMVSTSLIFSRFILTPKWRNSGTTPTKQMTISLQWTRTTSDEPPQFPVSDIKEPTSLVHTQSLFIGPQSITLSQTINIPLGDNVVGTTLDLFKCGNEKIFIWGKVEYEDIFGKKHVSESCYYLQFIINSIYEPILINYIQSGSQNSYREIG